MSKINIGENDENRVGQLKVTIICEGQEEEAYIRKLRSLHVWSPNVSVTVKGAGSVSKIIHRYKHERGNGGYKLLAIFCDAGEDENMSSRRDFERIIKMIKTDYKEDPFKTVFFANPATMQIFLSHLDKVHVKYELKKKNRKLIYSLTGIADYGSDIDHVEKLMSHITAENYQVMKDNLKDSNEDYHIHNSTNILRLLKQLETGKFE